MQIDLHRTTYTLNSTVGLIAIDGVNEFCSLEPSQYSGMLMPSGTFHCIKTMSADMHYVSPELQDVPGHTGERIHIGNGAKDTKGCILIGMSRSPDWIDMSGVAFGEFMSIVPDEFDITIHDQPEV